MQLNVVRGLARLNGYHGLNEVVSSHDELELRNAVSSNVNHSIRQHQRILQFTPLDTNELPRKVAVLRSELSPLFSGWLWLQIDSTKSIEHSGWRRYWCEAFVSPTLCVVTYRKQPTDKKFKGTINVAYVHIERGGLPQTQSEGASSPIAQPIRIPDFPSTQRPQSPHGKSSPNASLQPGAPDPAKLKSPHSTNDDTPTPKGEDDVHEYDDLYMGYLESQEGKYCFQVFSP